MNKLRWFAMVTSCVLAGCTNLPKSSVAKPAAEHGSSAAPHSQRQILNEGYSMLYHDAGNLESVELVLYVKVESDAVDGMVTSASQFGDDLKKQLEQIAKDYPAVRIDLDPLPEIEKRKRAALSKERAKYFAPVVGHGGREYERTVLIGYVNGANHERHLCQVMAEDEPNANLEKFLLDTEKRFDAIYDRANGLLEKEYFKDPNGKSRN